MPRRKLAHGAPRLPCTPDPALYSPLPPPSSSFPSPPKAPPSSSPSRHGDPPPSCRCRAGCCLIKKSRLAVTRASTCSPSGFRSHTGDARAHIQPRARTHTPTHTCARAHIRTITHTHTHPAHNHIHTLSRMHSYARTYTPCPARAATLRSCPSSMLAMLAPLTRHPNFPSLPPNNNPTPPGLTGGRACSMSDPTVSWWTSLQGCRCAFHRTVSSQPPCMPTAAAASPLPSRSHPLCGQTTLRRSAEPPLELLTATPCC
jgi:hypothetical protein